MNPKLTSMRVSLPCCQYKMKTSTSGALNHSHRMPKVLTNFSHPSFWAMKMAAINRLNATALRTNIKSIRVIETKVVYLKMATIPAAINPITALKTVPIRKPRKWKP